MCYVCNKKRLEALGATKKKNKHIRPRQYKADKRQQREDDHKFYMKIWEKRKHVCAYCGCTLFGMPKTYNFDHILEKSSFPKLRREKDNIALTCLECHNEKTSWRYTDTMRQIIKHTVNLFIKKGLLEEVGLPNVQSLKEWVKET